MCNFLNENNIFVISMCCCTIFSSPPAGPSFSFASFSSSKFISFRTSAGLFIGSASFGAGQVGEVNFSAGVVVTLAGGGGVVGTGGRSAPLSLYWRFSIRTLAGVFVWPGSFWTWFLSEVGGGLVVVVAETGGGYRVPLLLPARNTLLAPSLAATSSSASLSYN